MSIGNFSVSMAALGQTTTAAILPKRPPPKRTMIAIRDAKQAPEAR